jgi:hypothetical protein
MGGRAERQRGVGKSGGGGSGVERKGRGEERREEKGGFRETFVTVPLLFMEMYNVDIGLSCIYQLIKFIKNMKNYVYSFHHTL